MCPVSSATFQQLQKRLADASGKEVVLVSITVDPLREYAARYEAREGSVWLTGAKPEVDSVLKGLGAYSARFEDHPAMVLIGEARGGKWTRIFGFRRWTISSRALKRCIWRARSSDAQHS